MKLPKILNILDKGQIRALPLIVLAMIIGAGFEVIGLSFIIPVMEVITNPSQSYFLIFLKAHFPVINSNNEKFIVLALFAIFYIIKGIYLTFLAQMSGRFSFGIKESVNKKLMQRYVKGPYEFHLKNNSSKLINNLIKESSYLVDYSLNPILLIATESFVIIAMAIFLIWIEPQGSMIVAALLIIASLAFLGSIKKIIVELGKTREFADRKIAQNAQEAIGGIKDIKILSKEDSFMEQFQKYNKQSSDASSKRFFWHQVSRTYLESIFVLALSILFILITTTSDAISTKIATLGVFALATFRLLPSLNRILSSLNMLRFSSPTIANIEQQLNETHDLVDILSNKNAVETHYQFYKSIEIQNISYRYPDSDQLSLNNISLSIKKGESVGIIGKSGAGKSTLMDVILGLIPPSSGSIFVDGKSIHDDVSSWYRLVGYVQQDIFLIDASIRENIAFGIHEHDVDHERLSKAVRESQLDSFISSLSNGLDTQLGERGVRLSGGQKQRIGIARALYREASVLVLDEATSAIDNETEIELLSVIKNFKGKKTTIVIAHRLSTLVHCDWIVKLGNGAVENIIQGADMVNKFRE